MKPKDILLTIIFTLIFSTNVFAANPQFTFIHSYGDNSTKLYYTNYTDVDTDIISGKPVPNVGKQNILYVNGSVVPNIDILIKNNRSLIPLRTVSETLNYTVDWNSNTQTITITGNNNTAILTIGSTSLIANDNLLTLDVSPEIINGLTYVPVNALNLALGVETDYYLSDIFQDNFQIAFISIESTTPTINYDVETATNYLDASTKQYLNNYLSNRDMFGNAVIDIDTIFSNLDIYLVDTIGRYYVFNLWNRNTYASYQKVLFDMTNGDKYSIRADGSGGWGSVSTDIDGSAYSEEIIYDNITYPESSYSYSEESYYDNEIYDDYYTNNYSYSNTVYIGETGDKYHRESCSTLKGNGTPISLEDAIAQGRTACKVCKP